MNQHNKFCLHCGAKKSEMRPREYLQYYLTNKTTCVAMAAKYGVSDVTIRNGLLRAIEMLGISLTFQDNDGNHYNRRMDDMIYEVRQKLKAGV